MRPGADYNNKSGREFDSIPGPRSPNHQTANFVDVMENNKLCHYVHLGTDQQVVHLSFQEAMGTCECRGQTAHFSEGEWDTELAKVFKLLF